MMKRLFAFATNKLVGATPAAAQTRDADADADVDTDATPDARTDGGAAVAADVDRDAEEELLYADDDEFEAAFAEAWPSLPGEALTWLVEEGDTGPLLICYDRNSPSDDEYLQTPAHVRADDAQSAEE